jgi:hypothetical protein
MTILHSSFSHLVFPFHALDLLTMEDKRGVKRPRSPSIEGSQSHSDAKTPPSTPSESPPPLGSPSEISSHCPCPLVFEQGGSSGNVLVIDLSSSSDEEDFIANILWDAKITSWLFGDLNCNVLEPLGDGKVIILSDSNEEEEAREETTADADAMPSATKKSSTPAASAADDEDPEKMQDDNSDDSCPSNLGSFLRMLWTSKSFKSPNFWSP